MQQEKDLVQWHPAFYSAMELELAEDKGELIFEQEHILNKKPLQVDLLVIRKQSGIELQNEIGRLFREHNLLEYKNPDDSMNTDTWFKVWGYACLYKSYAGDELKADNVTVTLIRERKPKQMLVYFTEQGYEVRRAYQGIYYVEHLWPFRLQIVVGKELDPEQHVWLTALTKQMDKNGASRLLDRVRKVKDEAGQRAAEAVVHVALNANQETFEAWRKENPHMYESLLDFMKPDIDKRVNIEVDKSRDQERTEFALSLMQDSDWSDERIAKNSKLSIDRVRELRKGRAR